MCVFVVYEFFGGDLMPFDVVDGGGWRGAMRIISSYNIMYITFLNYTFICVVKWILYACVCVSTPVSVYNSNKYLLRYGMNLHKPILFGKLILSIVCRRSVVIILFFFWYLLFAYECFSLCV